MNYTGKIEINKIRRKKVIQNKKERIRVKKKMLIKDDNNYDNDDNVQKQCSVALTR